MSTKMTVAKFNIVQHQLEQFQKPLREHSLEYVIYETVRHFPCKYTRQEIADLYKVDRQVVTRAINKLCKGGYWVFPTKTAKGVVKPHTRGVQPGKLVYALSSPMYFQEMFSRRIDSYLLPHLKYVIMAASHGMQMFPQVKKTVMNALEMMNRAVTSEVDDVKKISYGRKQLNKAK